MAWQSFTLDPLYTAWAEGKCGAKVHLDPCSCRLGDQTQCDHGRITMLNMFGTGLPGVGGVPLRLLGLTGLIELHLGGNSLTGAVPAAVERLHQLTLLGMEANSLTGTIPAALGRLQQLQQLALGSNAISGTVPQELVALKRLTLLDLFSTPLTGRLPAFNFSQFTQCCALNGDNFTCPLPPGASACVGGPGCSPSKFPPPTCKW
jgi:hypothetical protein